MNISSKGDKNGVSSAKYISTLKTTGTSVCYLCLLFLIKSSKGMEFREVCVVDKEMSVNEKYIAYTRALAQLSVVHDLPVFSEKNKSFVVQGEDTLEEEDLT